MPARQERLHVCKAQPRHSPSSVRNLLPERAAKERWSVDGVHRDEGDEARQPEHIPRGHARRVRVRRDPSEVRHAHRVAEGVREQRAEHQAGAEEEVRRVRAEERGVGELEGDGDPALPPVDPVVHVRRAEGERGEEHRLAFAPPRAVKQRAHARAEDPLLRERPDEQVARELQPRELRPRAG
eukprot:CAMPEP_0195587430 /NCGR_PEP_ID=MMETSP0814-20130614/30976_1 /TAXON_ID=97485 /ORGANISM="Prymnesium parvum, Strain Texoma1" /LENGTH=182 /DNA_ID=CAMNT_0040726195 /DNA_START=120 /DNA_END=665 /DNA_ORIENTATION=-